MDNNDPTFPEARFVPDRRYTAAAGSALVVALLAALLTSDRDGRLLAGIAVVVLAAYVLGDLVFSPRLVVSGAGLVVRSPLTRAQLHWGEIEDVRADSRTRLGLRSTTLEIDAGEVLAVLSRRALGADPADVAALVLAFRPPSPGGRT